MRRSEREYGKAFGWSLILSFVGVVVLGAGAALFTLVNLERTVRLADRAAHRDAQMLVEVERLRFAAAQVVSASRGYLFTGAQRYLDRKLAAADRVQAALADLREGPTTDELAAVEDALGPYLRATEAAVAQRDTGDLDGLLEMFEREVSPRQAALDDALEQFAESRERHFHESLLELQERHRHGLAAATAGIVVSLVLAAVIAWSGARRLNRLFAAEHAAVGVAEREALARDELMAIVSHDLRNPLAGILLAVERALATAGDEPRTRRALESARRSAKQMNRLIGDLLDLTSAETGRPAVDLAPCDLVPVVNEVVTGFEGIAREKQIEVRAAIHEASVPVVADGDRLGQVLSNLIGNALKFTPPSGHVRVELRTTPDRAVLEVGDTGPGIPREDLPHLFDRFWQSPDTRRAGVGLGLHIARLIVEAHHGTIGVESEPGQGTTFRVTLPLTGSA